MTLMAPRTSIITLTQDRPAYLAEAIASVQAQDDPDIEHVVYDNGSTSLEVAQILREAKERDPDRFFYYRAAKSDVVRGVGIYWNAIIRQMARGRYITILDDDNRKLPSFVSEMALAMESMGAEAVTCGWHFIDESGERRGTSTSNRYTTPATLWHNNTVDSGAILFRREAFEAVGGFPTHLEAGEDWYFIAKLVQRGHVVHLPAILFEYRRHSGTKSASLHDAIYRDTVHKVRSEIFASGGP